MSNFHGVSARNPCQYSLKLRIGKVSLYRAVDKTGQTIDFLLTEQRDEQAAKRFLTKAIRRHGVPEKITIDGSAANEAAIKSYNEEHAPRSKSARSSISTTLWNKTIEA